jgi:osomolarity two-component system, phosphorelay intermediate protein YPD1
VIEMPTFRQILEMDDDEDERDFSRSIVFEFFDQAENTFAKMDSALYVLHYIPIFEMQHQTAKSSMNRSNLSLI